MKVRAAWISAGLIGAWVASAQVPGTALTLDLQGTSTFQGQSTLVVSPRDCGLTPSLTWTATAQGTSCSELRMWVTAGQCGDEPVAGDLLLPDVQGWQTQRTGTVTIPIQSLPVFSANDGGSPCGSAVDQLDTVCGRFKYATFVGCTSPVVVHATTSPVIHYEGVPPSQPTISGVDPLDGGLRITVVFDSRTTLIRLAVRSAGSSDPFLSAGSFTSDQPSGKITGLANGTTYEIQATAEDAAGNDSPPSASATGTPVLTEGFFGKYQRYGGAERGGCGATGASLGGWIGVGLCALLRLSRRRGCR